MNHEAIPNRKTRLDSGEFKAERHTWARIGAQCELILGGIDGQKLSQRTWVPDEQANALQQLGISYGLTMVLARVGQTEPTPDTLYELTASSRDFTTAFHFSPYKVEPFGMMTGDQPKLVATEQLPQARTAMLLDYLNTYLGDHNG